MASVNSNIRNKSALFERAVVTHGAKDATCSNIFHESPPESYK